MRVTPITATSMIFCMLPASVYAASAQDVGSQLIPELGKLNLLSIIVLIACLVSARLVEPLRRKLLIGVALLICLVSQGRSFLDSYRNSGLYQPRKTMAVSDLQISDKLFNGRRFMGKKVLPLLVADHIPKAKIFLYSENLYSKELLGWSGRNPDSAFVIGGYPSTMGPGFKMQCLRRPHVIYDGLYLAMPLSIYENENEVFLMKDESMDYLIPGSWRVSRHE